MTKEEIAGVLEQIATLLELKGENLFKIRVSANAARAIETFGGNISNFQDEEALAKIPGGGAGPCDEAANWMSTFPEGNAIASARPDVSYLIFQTMVGACRRGRSNRPRR